jgi:predicted PurR-regulated permease PerM
MQHQLHANTIRQILFLIVLILLSWVIGKELYFLLGAFLGAVTLYIIMRNFMFKLVIKLKWKKWLAALTLILGSFIIIVVPTIWIVSILIEKFTPFINNPELIKTTSKTIHDYLVNRFQIDIFNANTIEKLNGHILPYIQKGIGGTFSALGTIFMMYLMLYFMLTGSSSIEKWLRNNMPFKGTNVETFINEFRNLVYSNAIGIPIVALLQGLVGLIGYMIFGVDEFLLMGLLTAVCSVIPVVGSMIIYVPLGIYELALGHTWQGVAILVWGFALIGSVDNIARFMIQKRIANVHPLITIFGVIMGINLFGFIGIIFGPLMLSMFTLLIKIYIDEFGRVEAEQPEIHRNE